MYQLKKGVESFEVVDGEFAGKRFSKGKTYDKIPPGEETKFERLESQEAGKLEGEKAVKPESREASKRPSVLASKSEPEVKP